jgi:peroxiredoxin/outer membrane lipoprotein-sorting protein
MKRILPLFLTLSAAPFVQAHAAPEPAAPATPASPEAVVPPEVEPAAAALLEKSAQAYSALNALSLHFVTTRTAGDKTTTSSGDVSASLPDKVRVEMTTGADSSISVSDGAKFWSQLPTKPAMYQVQDIKEGMGLPLAMNRANSAMAFSLSSLISGQNIVEMGYRWGTVSAVPDNGVKFSIRPANTPAPMQLTVTAYFDPIDSLVRRLEVSTTYKGNTTVTSTTLTDVKTNPTFTPAVFTYTPGDVKLYVAPPMYDPKLVVGATPYALKAKDMAGKTHSWDEYKGKVVLLDFWATWCGPCIGELPNVLKAYETYHPKGFEIIGVSLDTDQKALTDFIKDRDLKYVNLFDGQGWKAEDGQSYGVQAIPFTLLIGKDGKIAAVNPRGPKLEPALVEALAK